MTAIPPDPSSSAPIPSFSAIRTHTQEVFHVRPCLWQMKVVEAILQGDKDVLCIAGTGMGKTLTFWMPLLFRPDGIQIVVTPLNLLGKQNVTALTSIGIPAISISSETSTPANFHAIRARKYRAIVISPEQMMKADGPFEKILKDAQFTSHIISIVIDEAHCLTDWGKFRPEYRELGRIQYLVPFIPLLVTSATLTKTALSDVTRLLQMRKGKTITLRRSSDHPNIKIGVKKIKYALNSFADLAFLVPDGYKGDPPLPKFLIFFDSIADSIAAAGVLRKRLPAGLKEKIKWFNADMSVTFKETEYTNLVTGETWGLCTTTSFGMGMDVPDISLVVQWRTSCNISALWQRFGRAARNRQLTGTALLFAEREHFDDERAAKAVRKAETQKRKGKDADLPGSLRPAKRGPASNHCTESQADNMDIGSLTAVVNGISDSSSLDPGIDLLINAESRPGLGCRRVVFDVCFDNRTADTDHLTCSTDTDQGCDRCHVKESDICCDIHNSLDFLQYTSTVSKQRRAMQRSRISKYTKEKHDYDLENTLLDWRESKTAAVYGWAALNRRGPSIVMTDATLDAIVDYAHHDKIQTPQDLKRETGWMRSEQFGNEIIELIRTHTPPRPSPFVSTPLQPSSIALNTFQAYRAPSPTPVVKRRNKCSACGQEGHNARNKICPRQQSELSAPATGKENVMSASPSL